jgi:lysophospholipase L1-like esterase
MMTAIDLTRTPIFRVRTTLAASFVLFVAGSLWSQAASQTGGDEKAGDLHVGRLRVDKVLFLGNSITLHGPKSEIGWLGNWGMAASVEANDFVHLLTEKIAKAARGRPRILAQNIADFERGFQTYRPEEGLRNELEFKPDLVVVAIGENVPPLSTDLLKAEYRDAFRKLIATLRRHGNPTIIVRSCFWADPAKDEIMRAICKELGGRHVDIGALGKDPRNMAGSERKIDHAGVANHPGDRGMQAIADAIWGVIRERGAK